MVTYGNADPGADPGIGPSYLRTRDNAMVFGESWQFLAVFIRLLLISGSKVRILVRPPISSGFYGTRLALDCNHFFLA